MNIDLDVLDYNCKNTTQFCEEISKILCSEYNKVSDILENIKVETIKEQLLILRSLHNNLNRYFEFTERFIQKWKKSLQKPLQAENRVYMENSEWMREKTEDLISSFESIIQKHKKQLVNTNRIIEKIRKIDEKQPSNYN